MESGVRLVSIPARCFFTLSFSTPRAPSPWQSRSWQACLVRGAWLRLSQWPRRSTSLTWLPCV
ncbi:hypothetical protein M0657_000047 [Pyricularia oryzae]|uniref:Uncharacterized protein n=1 Tax=Pyricularia oryzae TaxID=318829 RepID=A0A4P7N3P7_PYROR|nr:hypothetical protein M9X92_000179 [Pyricularia oryzae]KAI7932738.1 hypothetical protein M0657_000047 [Pyricularia oryzae]QBZ56132.1 hypothetical protein PoMZ_01038 [Pyricularia oryzae]